MKPYFEKMPNFGKPLSERQLQSSDENVKKIREVEQEIAEAVKKVKAAGIPTEEINKRGEMTVYQRLEYLVDPGTWCPCTPSMTRWRRSPEPPGWWTGWAKSAGNGR